MDGAGALNHLRLSVRDPDASAALYDPVLTLLGYEQVSRDDGGRAWGRADESGREAVADPHAVAPEHRDAPAHDRTAPGFHHLALNAADRAQVDPVHDLLVELGADVLDPPAEYDYGPGYYAVFFRDPDGFKLEVVHLP